MTSMTQPRRSRAIAQQLRALNEDKQWESFIVSMLKKLELPEEKRRAAQERYEQFAHHVATKMGLDIANVHVVVQGSMRTQTTIAGDGREKFDLDVVVKLSGPRFTPLRESEWFFQAFGKALEGIEGAGQPQPKNRCWRLQYPGEPFYFDVTPAIPNSLAIIGTDLRVRDPKTDWSPSNPEDFAEWFCDIADQRFPFQYVMLEKSLEARSHADPIPSEPIGLDDILRRMVQLMKLHRDYHFKHQPDEIRETMPISVILVTLAGHAYKELVENEAASFSSAIEVALELVSRMPDYIDRSTHIKIDNPAMQGQVRENFADRWNGDGGARDKSFRCWHKRLTLDLEALFSESYSKKAEERVREIFGQQGVRAWKGSHEEAPDLLVGAGILQGLKATSPSHSAQPQQPRKTGAGDTLA